MAPDGADSYFMLEFRSSKATIATTSVFMIFTDVFLYGLVVPVFPFALEERFHVPKEQLHSALSLAIGISGAGVLFGSPICGYITELCATRRYPLLAGLFLLMVSTCLIRFGTELWVLVLGRLVGGFAAAMTWVVGQALLVDRVEEDETGRYLGLLGVSANAALFVGPLLGGWVYERLGYEAVFNMALLLILFDIVLRFLIIEPKMLKQILSRSSTPKYPSSPTATLVVAEASSHTETSPLLPNAKPSSSISSEPEPALGPENVWIPLLTSPRLLNAIWATILEAALGMALETTLPLFAKTEFGYGSKQTGWLFITLIVPQFAAPLIGYLRDKVLNPHAMILAGFAFTAPLFVALGFMGSKPLLPSSVAEALAGADPHRVALTCVILLAYGAGMAVLGTPVSAEFADAVRDLEREGKLRKGGQGLGIAYSMNSTAFAVGALAGPFIGGLVKGRWGWKIMTFVLAAMSLLGCIPLAILMMATRRSKSGTGEGVAANEAVGSLDETDDEVEV